MKNLGSSGASLIELMIGVTILGVVAAGIVAMVDHGNRGMLALQQKYHVLETQQEIFRDLSSATVCSCNFNPAVNTANGSPLTFDSNNLGTASIDLAAVYSTCVSNTLGNPIARAGQILPGASSSVVVSRIRLGQMAPTGTPGNFRAELQVEFDSEKLVLSRKPASVSMTFQADLANPSQARILSCSTANGSGGGGGGPYECPVYTYSNGFLNVTIPRGPLGAIYVPTGFGPGGNFIPLPPSSCGVPYYVCGTQGSTSPPTVAWTPTETGLCDYNGGP